MFVDGPGSSSDCYFEQVMQHDEATRTDRRTVSVAIGCAVLTGIVSWQPGLVGTRPDDLSDALRTLSTILVPAMIATVVLMAVLVPRVPVPFTIFTSLVPAVGLVGALLRGQSANNVVLAMATTFATGPVASGLVLFAALRRQLDWVFTLIATILLYSLVFLLAFLWFGFGLIALPYAAVWLAARGDSVRIASRPESTRTS